MTEQQFRQQLKTFFNTSDKKIVLGAPILNDVVLSDIKIFLALKSLNRHGLIAGATGTGKTKTIQLLAEQCSDNGIPSLIMDLKGDLSGLGAAATPTPDIKERQEKIGLDFIPKAYPIEFLSLSNEPGVHLRSTISEMGPIIFSKLLALNDTQAGIVAIIFKYCSDHNLPLLNLDDFKAMLDFISDAGKKEVEQEYGLLANTSISTIRRKIVELEQQGVETFLGEPSFDIHDLIRHTADQNGVISILRLADLQNRPKLFATFMISLLAELYQTLPEIGDPEKPVLILVIDEAHLIFTDASQALLNKIESIVRLIRSKGVGVFFCSQSATDIPEKILAQLGTKFQHALRAFTAKDRKEIKLIAENFPTSQFYKTDELLTSLGIGEAAVTVLDDKGQPSPLIQVLLQAPRSRMGTLTAGEINALIAQSTLIKKYAQTIDNTSAKELLAQRLNTADVNNQETSKNQRNKKEADSILTKLSKNTMVRQMGRTILQMILGALLALLGLKKKR